MARFPLLLVLAALALAGCGGSSEEGAPAAGQVTELQSVGDVRAAFEADRGKPRVVLLLSPT